MSSMEIRLAPDRSISEIQREFSAEFPYLKLEFTVTGSKKMLEPHQKFGKAQASSHNGNIEILPEMRVKDLEQKFKDDFAVIAQVFRRSGNSWLQTTMTDGWTLKQQNTHGKEISDVKNVKKIPDTDFDLERNED